MNEVRVYPEHNELIWRIEIIWGEQLRICSTSKCQICNLYLDFPKKLLDFVWFWRRYFEFDLFPLCIRRENPSPRMKCQEIGVSSNLKNLRRIELEDWQQQRLQECIMGKRGSKHFFSILAIRKRTKVSFFWDLSQDISSSGL